MPTSLERNAYAQSQPPASGNTTLIVVLGLTVAFGYFGCVRPMTEQVRAMRVSMACMQSRVAKLVREADAAGQNAGLLERLAEQRAATQHATEALDEIEALNRRLAERTRRIALLAASEDLAIQTTQRITEHRELLGAAELALEEAASVQQRLVDAQRKVSSAAVAADRMNALCSRLIAAAPMVEDAHAASEDMAALQDRMILAARSTPAASESADRLGSVVERLAAKQADTQLAVRRLSDLEGLQARLTVIGQQNVPAAEALETLADLRHDVTLAEGELTNLREAVMQFVLMRPAIDRAVATLGPIRELATLRHLDADRLQVAATALRLSEEGTLAK